MSGLYALASAHMFHFQMYQTVQLNMISGDLYRQMLGEL
jgi:hypothetical protein